MFKPSLPIDAGVAEEEVVRVRMPRTKDGEILGIADQLLGASRVRVMCADGNSRLGRIPGKLKKRMWIREGDLLVVKVWQFQDEKCDIKHRYTKTEASYMARRGLIPKSINVFGPHKALSGRDRSFCGDDRRPAHAASRVPGRCAEDQAEGQRDAQDVRPGLRPCRPPNDR